MLINFGFGVYSLEYKCLVSPKMKSTDEWLVEFLLCYIF